jgi:hypothetical protein
MIEMRGKCFSSSSMMSDSCVIDRRPLYQKKLVFGAVSDRYMIIIINFLYGL